MPNSPSLDEFADVEDLRGTIRNLTRQLAKAKGNEAEYVAAVFHGARDAMRGLAVPPIAPPKRDGRKRTAEVCVPLVSDLQLAKVTPDYNSEVCAERMARYAQKIIRLTEIQRSDHPVRKAVVCVLGDVIEGVEIFPGQQWLIDAGLYRQIMVDGPAIFLEFFRTLLTCFDTIECHWVIGNHGRIGRKGVFDPESNGDRILGKLMQMLLAKEPRISFTVPDGKGERNWYSIARVGNWSALCLHGDQIRGQLGFPWYGLGKKVNGWAAGAIREPFDHVLMGHHHQLSCIPLNRRKVWANGSTESMNTYAQENMGSMGDPEQWTLFVDPEGGRVTASYGVDLS